MFKRKQAPPTRPIPQEPGTKGPLRRFLTRTFDKKWKVVLAALLSLLLLSLGGLYLYAHGLLSLMTHESIDTGNLSIMQSDSAYYNQVTGISNIVLFGIDTEGNIGRSDAIMIVTIDENSKTIKLSSVARDAYVNIPGHGMDKITHAFSFGGAQLAIQTLNENFGLDIRSYALANFYTLPKIIDALGGVSIYLTEKEVPEVPDIPAAGTYILNGEQALAFARIRNIDGDANRNQRQRDVMKAIFTKMFAQSITSYPSTLNRILPSLTTNLTPGEILLLAGKVVTQGITTIEEQRFPDPGDAVGQKIDGVYYTVFDIAETREKMGRYIYLNEPLPVE